MSEWKLFDGTPPETAEALRARGWMFLAAQPGFDQRANMVTGLVALAIGLRRDIHAVTELGCGDGSLLALLPAEVKAWGYELGEGDVEHAQSRGLDVRQADILADPLEYGDLLIVSEVLEHLEDPAAFLRELPAGRIVVASSPSAETLEWHNPVHSWAWDTGGYRDLFAKAGWRVLYQIECAGGPNTFGEVSGTQRFQAAVAVRP